MSKKMLSFREKNAFDHVQFAKGERRASLKRVEQLAKGLSVPVESLQRAAEAASAETTT